MRGVAIALAFLALFASVEWVAGVTDAFLGPVAIGSIMFGIVYGIVRLVRAN